MDDNNQVTQWEYRKFTGKSFSEQELNQLGEQGWELTGSTSAGPTIFKRPKVKQTKTEPEYSYTR